MITGCYTALVTPFNNYTVDYEGLEKLAEFQIKNGITGILAAGTTGESPTLTWDEHNNVIEAVAKKAKGKCLCVAGCGSNNTKEACEAVSHAKHVGVDSILLVDPYYNGPSSLEIRHEYYEPIAKSFPDLTLIPYIIPGRTGAQMFPEDLALLSKSYPNVKGVKEATGDINNMRRTRECAGDDFLIISGDDAMVFEMMTDPLIKASGVFSVGSNIVPKFITDMIKMIEAGEVEEARKLNSDLTPLFNLTTVITEEETPFGKVTCRARNPLGLKTLMSLLGMPSGGCRRPLGKMTKNGFDYIHKVAKEVQAKNPELFMPIAEFFNIDIDKRLNSSDEVTGLYYDNTY